MSHIKLTTKYAMTILTSKYNMRACTVLCFLSKRLKSSASSTHIEKKSMTAYK